MFKRPALMIALALLVAAILTLTFSPAARAAVQSIFDFNGVTVSIDDETGKLVTSGNTDAIIEQGDNYVAIQGEDNAVAGVVVASNADGDVVDANELISQFPDLVLPDVPDGYTLDAQALRMDDGSLSFSWTDAAGNVINYSRSPNPPQVIEIGVLTPLTGEQPLGELPPDTTLPADGSSLNVEAAIGVASGSGEIITSATLLPSYEWQAGGYYHYLFATDPNLTAADLQAMLP